VNKKNLVIAFLEHLEEELGLAKKAALATYDAATNEESKPENEYDTRALEASYLAGAQAKRVQEIEGVIQDFHRTSFKEFNARDPIDISALVGFNLDGRPSVALIMPKGGGVRIDFNDQSIQIVTPSSVLGETLMGLSVADHAEFEVGDKVRKIKVDWVK
jgi:hypothetical protein